MQEKRQFDYKQANCISNKQTNKLNMLNIPIYSE